jgi:hypothetical protein
MEVVSGGGELHTFFVIAGEVTGMKYIYDILMNFSDILFPSFSESTEKIAN